MRFIKCLLAIQGIYFLLTACWPLIDIDSFMFVTGYKTDVWLVKTVGALLIAISLCLLSFLLYNIDVRPAVVLGATSCLGLLLIDVYYALTDVIADIYLLDALAEAGLLLLWLFIIITKRWMRG